MQNQNAAHAAGSAAALEGLYSQAGQMKLTVAELAGIRVQTSAAAGR